MALGQTGDFDATDAERRASATDLRIPQLCHFDHFSWSAVDGQFCFLFNIVWAYGKNIEDSSSTIIMWECRMELRTSESKAVHCACRVDTIRLLKRKLPHQIGGRTETALLVPPQQVAGASAEKLL